MPQLFDRIPGTISLSGGLPDLTVLPAAKIAELTSRMLRLGSRTLLQYSTPTVSSSLIPAILDLAARTGMTPDPDHLVPTAGSQLGMMMVANILDGDAIVCDSPTYPGALAAWASADMDLIGVAGDEEGLNPDALAHTISDLRGRGRRVAAVYTTPTFQNPTGSVQSEARRADILEICARNDLLVIEDDPYGMLSFEGRTWPALKSMDPDRVIYLGTFSKVFAPGVRCGWIDPPADLVDDLRAMCEVMTLSPSALNQAIIGEYHRRHGWDDLLEAYRASYRDRAQALSHALESELTQSGQPTTWTWRTPQGGFYLWLENVSGVSGADVARRAAANGVRVVPGLHFDPAGLDSPSMRVSFSYPRPTELTEGARRLAAALVETGVSA
ncbi:PLP-dependent aminotransferase family protein [Cutibacterium sp. WCA-380-WT-3A]|uniref:PLP-dependent aminotransferase family protein n=2 Tax=Cutibacterium porci TaxID=2605781 RepID=A0A7K0J3W3_9ACTN|nr:PLP-dependent aminotransferase family protein [Cutibacterium porci]